MVFSFDEKPQGHAIDPTQPGLPMVAGSGGRMTHDDKRHGTTDLFAAMNVGTGQVLTRCGEGHAATDVLRFFKDIDVAVPRRLAVHVVLDSLSAHKAPAIIKWLVHDLDNSDQTIYNWRHQDRIDRGQQPARAPGRTPNSRRARSVSPPGRPSGRSAGV